MGSLTHTSRRYIRGDLATRFNARVDRSGGLDACHPWTGPIRPDGYAYLSVTRSDHRLVHVIAWTLEHGPVPPGKQLDHECHNKAVLAGDCQPGPCSHRSCCNERHILARTPLEHRAQTVHQQISLNVGSANGRSVLDEALVREIKIKLRAGGRTGLLAAEYKVSPSAISEIKSGRRWSQVVI